MIDRVSDSALVPLITQRFEVSPATVLAPDRVLPLVPVGPFMAPAPDGGLNPAPAKAPAQATPEQAGASPRDTSAMQANQLFLSRQLVWHQPDTAALAASWRVMVRTYGEQRAAQDEQARGQHLPGQLLMAESATLREHAPPPLTMGEDAWRFAVYGWGSQKLSLRVLASDAEEEPKTAPRRPRGKVALRLELQLPAGGRLLIQMEPVDDGIVLDLASDDLGALRHVRARLTELADAIHGAGLRIFRCRIGKALHTAQIHNNYAMQAAAASLSLPLFRAMAEVAVLLSRPHAEAAPALAGPPPPALPTA